MIGPIPHEECETMPDGRVDTPDDLDMVRVNPPTIVDMCGADG